MRSTLTAASCVRNFPSQNVERHNKPEVEVRRRHLKGAETIQSVTLSYLRNPIEAKWTYTIVDQVEMYNPSKSDFKEIDIHPSEEADLILRVLQSFGINLKEPELQKVTEQIKTSEFNKEITT